MTNLLETERLIIRSWIPERDAEQAFVMYSDPEVTHFLSKASRPASIESQRQRLIEGIERCLRRATPTHLRNNGTGSWAIVEKETTTIVGTILLLQLPDKAGLLTQDYEVGWHLRRASWGKGYATEAGRVMLNYGFSVLNLPVIYAVVKPENHLSIRVTQRLSMKPMGRTNKYYGIELLLFQLDAPEKSRKEQEEKEEQGQGGRGVEFKDSSASIKDSLTEFKDSSASIKDSLTEFKDSSASIKDLLTEFKDSSASIKDSLTEFKDSSASIKDSLTEFKDSSASIKDLLASIKDSLTEFKDSLASIKDSCPMTND